MLNSTLQHAVRAVAQPVAPPTAGDVELHRVLLTQVRRGSRVALLGEDAVLARRLEEAGCTLVCYTLSELGSGGRLPEPVHSALQALQPELIALLDEWVAAPSPEALLRELRAAAPSASLALSFRNATSANSLVDLLTGGDVAPMATEEQVHRWLAASGLALHLRLPVRDTQLGGRLARQTEQALLQLFQQLNPSSSVDRLLYVVCEPVEASALEHQPSHHVPGLLSVIIRNQSLARLGYLDHAIFSLACQDYTPLEIVVVSQSQEQGVVDALRGALERHQPLGGYSYQVLREPSPRDIRARLLNIGIRAARGQYIAFLDDDDVVYPQHYERLIGLLKKGHAAWAVGRTQRAYFRTDSQGSLFCYNKVVMPRPESFDIAALVVDNFITCHSYVVDRSRLGQFPFEFPEHMTVLEDYLFLLRFAALFSPDFLAGPSSCEYRIRDDGSNSVLTDNLAGQLRTDREQQWSMARHAKDLAKRDIQMLMTERQFEQHLEHTRQQALQSAEAQARSAEAHRQILEGLRSHLRFHLADWANGLLKQRLPGAHQTVKSLAKRLLG